MYEPWGARLNAISLCTPSLGENITTAHVKKLWPESFDTFDVTRKELDPYNIFINDYLAQRLL